MFQFALQSIFPSLSPSLSAPFALSPGWDWLIAATELICNVLGLMCVQDTASWFCLTVLLTGLCRSPTGKPASHWRIMISRLQKNLHLDCRVIISATPPSPSPDLCRALSHGSTVRFVLAPWLLLAVYLYFYHWNISPIDSRTKPLVIIKSIVQACACQSHQGGSKETLQHMPSVAHCAHRTARMF